MQIRTCAAPSGALHQLEHRPTTSSGGGGGGGEGGEGGEGGGDWCFKGLGLASHHQCSSRFILQIGLLPSKLNFSNNVFSIYRNPHWYIGIYLWVFLGWETLPGRVTIGLGCCFQLIIFYNGLWCSTFAWVALSLNYSQCTTPPKFTEHNIRTKGPWRWCVPLFGCAYLLLFLCLIKHHQGPAYYPP